MQCSATRVFMHTCRAANLRIREKKNKKLQWQAKSTQFIKNNKHFIMNYADTLLFIFTATTVYAADKQMFLWVCLRLVLSIFPHCRVANWTLIWLNFPSLWSLLIHIPAVKDSITVVVPFGWCCANTPVKSMGPKNPDWICLKFFKFLP